MNTMSILVTATNAVMPLVLLILLGYLLKQSGFLSRDFIKTGNSLGFYVFLPSLLFVNVYDIQGFSAIPWDVVLYCVAMLLVIFTLGYFTSVLITDVPQRRGVIWQCSFRSNFGIIGLSLAAALGGEAAIAVAAIVSSFSIPLFNMLAVISLSVFVQTGGDKKQDLLKILNNIGKNPLILSVALGLVCLVIREIQIACWGAPVFTLKDQGKLLYTTLSNLKAVASPFALVILGGQFEFSALRGLLKEIVAGTVWRILLAPLLGIGGAILLCRYCGFQWGAQEYPTLVAMFGSPAAVSSAIMAGSMGSDEQLASQLVVWTSLFSIITVFAAVCILMAMGLLPV